MDSLKIKNYNKSNKLGLVVAVELLLITAVLVVALFVGWVVLRDSFVAELLDIGSSVNSVDQSYCYSGISGSGASDNQNATISGSKYRDLQDINTNAAFQAALGEGAGGGGAGGGGAGGAGGGGGGAGGGGGGAGGGGDDDPIIISIDDGPTDVLGNLNGNIQREENIIVELDDGTIDITIEGIKGDAGNPSDNNSGQPSTIIITITETNGQGDVVFVSEITLYSADDPFQRIVASVDINVDNSGATPGTTTIDENRVVVGSGGSSLKEVAKTVITIGSSTETIINVDFVIAPGSVIDPGSVEITEEIIITP